MLQPRHAHAHARFPAALAALLLIAFAGGCDNNVRAERDLLHEQNTELQGELSSSRSALEGAERERARMIEQLAAERERLAQEEAEVRLASAPADEDDHSFGEIGDGVTVEQDGGEVTVRVPGDVLFDAGSAELKPASRRALDSIARTIQSDYAGRTIRVEGHTDTDPIRKSDWKDNMELSLARATAVYRYLQSQGVDAGRMSPTGFGESRPRDTKSQSRRVEIVVVGR